MKTLKQISEEYPPVYASELANEYYPVIWAFVLKDGKIIRIPYADDSVRKTHAELLGIDYRVEEKTESMRAFCRKHHAVRIAHETSFLSKQSSVYVEIFDVMPNALQLDAIKTLFLSRPDSDVRWDIWNGDAYKSVKGSTDRHSYGDFLRALSSDYKTPTGEAEQKKQTDESKRSARKNKR